MLGLLAMYSEEQRILIRKDKCKWCNHVTMALSELRSNVDLVENGVMSLSYFFLDSNIEVRVWLGSHNYWRCMKIGRSLLQLTFPKSTITRMSLG